MEKPLISILIPAYNVSRYVEECLDSVVNQTYQNLEIIVINDGSTDDTLNKLKKYKESIKIYSQKNKGVSFTRNKLLSLMTGEYFMFVDADDMLEINTCEVLANLIKENNLDILFFNMHRDDYNPTNTDRFYKIKKEYLIKASNFIHLNFKYQTYTNTPCCKIYKRYLSKYIYFEGVSSEDFYFSYKPYSYVEKCGYLDSSLYYYRNNVNSLTHIYDQNLLNIFIFKCWCIRIHFYESRKEYKYSVPCTQHASSLLLSLIKHGKCPEQEDIKVFKNAKKITILAPLYSIKNVVLRYIIKKNTKNSAILSTFQLN